tara:strand:- start:1677 stop:1802 length:126 start_codon:yes stop_codon:yes gene_type:complete
MLKEVNHISPINITRISKRSETNLELISGSRYSDEKAKTIK